MEQIEMLEPHVTLVSVYRYRFPSPVVTHGIEVDVQVHVDYQCNETKTFQGRGAVQAAINFATTTYPNMEVKVNV